MALCNYRVPTSGYCFTRENWLGGILKGLHNPKPPEWWLRAQEQNEGRDRRTAAIIWARHYKADRKFAIWSQAQLDDFIALGYYVE